MLNNFVWHWEIESPQLLPPHHDSFSWCWNGNYSCYFSRGDYLSTWFVENGQCVFLSHNALTVFSESNHQKMCLNKVVPIPYRRPPPLRRQNWINLQLFPEMGLQKSLITHVRVGTWVYRKWDTHMPSGGRSLREKVSICGVSKGILPKNWPWFPDKDKNIVLKILYKTFTSVIAKNTTLNHRVLRNLAFASFTIEMNL